MDIPITIITPTTGHSRLKRLIDSLQNQDVLYRHLILWDDKRESEDLDGGGGCRLNPFDLEDEKTNCIVIKGNLVQGEAYGSALRAVGLMIANTPYVTFADTDVWYEKDHLSNLLETIGGKEWAYCRRKIWANENDYLGVDNFESVGDALTKKVPYEIVDNNCMIFTRKFGASSACIYRETCYYNDDRLMYQFLKKYAGEPNKSLNATINQICPERLVNFFRENCTKE